MSVKLIGNFSSFEGKIDLKKVWVLGKAKVKISQPSKITFSLDDETYFEPSLLLVDGEFDFNNLVARYLKAEGEFEIEVYQGEGYIGVSEKKWDKLFAKEQYWVGGDGLYSFNLNGSDNYQSKEDDVTFCVFGDTFACTLGHDESRLEPLAMPNNSYCIIKKKNPSEEDVEFFLNEDDKGHCKAFLEPENELAYSGTMAFNLINYNPEQINNNYLSSINPKKDIEIVFTLNDKTYIDHLEILNYFVKTNKDLNYQGRGVNQMKVYLDGLFNQDVNLSQAEFALEGKNPTKVVINKECQEIKFVISNQIGIGNFGGANGKEAFFGLNKVYIYDQENILLTDLKVEANSEFLKKSNHAWFWLQDGIILDHKFYSLPFVVTSDITQPEGFQFKIDGISLIEADVKNNDVDLRNNRQKTTNLYQKIDGRTWNFGCGFYNNSHESLEEDSDGYIYIYGYTSSFAEFDKGNRMRVARVLKEHFTDLNKWEYYTGQGFSRKMEDAIPVLDHVSCELSVHRDHGKYIAVFTYNTQSKYIAYAESPTPYGPFSDIRIAYVCPENLCPHMYLYNAKAHPHLSSEGDILVSYNINTSNFDENIQFGRTYGPRFLRLKRIGGNK